MLQVRLVRGRERYEVSGMVSRAGFCDWSGAGPAGQKTQPKISTRESKATPPTTFSHNLFMNIRCPSISVVRLC